MADFASLEIGITVKGAKEAKAAITGLGSDFSKVDKTVSGSNMDKKFIDTSHAINTAKVAIAGFFTVASARKILEFTEAWTNASNRLRVVTDTTKELRTAQIDLLATANATRTNFNATAELYSKLARSTEALNLSHGELVDLTATISKSFSASGATAAEAEGAIRQLGQALASGALRGDEFNSIAEQAPAIMRAIAKETNLSIGELRDFAAEGKISAEIVVRALQSAADEIDGDFAATVATFGQKMEVVKNNLSSFFGEVEEGGGAVDKFGDTLVVLSENVDAVATTVTAAGVALSLRFVPVVAGLAGPLGIAAVAVGGLYIAIKELAEYMASDDIRNMSAEGILSVDGLGLDQLDAEIGSVLNRLTGLTTAIEEFSSGRNGKRYLLSDLYQDHLDEAEQMAIQLDNLADARQQFVAAFEDIADVESNNHSFNLEFDLTLPAENKEKAIITVEEAIAEIQAEMDASPHKFSLEFDFTLPEGPLVPGSDADFPLNDPRYQEARKAAEDHLQKVNERASEFDRTLERMYENIQRSFGDELYEFLDEGKFRFKDFFDSVIDMMKRFVAEMAAADIMNAIFKGDFSFSNLTGIVSGIANAVSTVAGIVSGGGAAGAVAGGAGAASGAASAVAGGAGVVSAVKGVGAAVAKGAAALMTNPWTYAIGALALGAANDWWADPDGYKRSNSGMLVGPTPGADPSRTFSVDPFASGLAPVGFNRRGTQSDAESIINEFRAIDSILVEYIGKLGGSIDLAGRSLHGVGEDGVFGTAGTFLGVGGKTQSVDPQFLSFAKQIIANAGGLDPALISSVQSAGSLSEINSILEKAVPQEESAAENAVAGASVMPSGGSTLSDVVAAIISFRDPVVGWLTSLTELALNGQITWYKPSPAEEQTQTPGYNPYMTGFDAGTATSGGESMADQMLTALAGMNTQQMTLYLKQFTEVVKRWDIDGLPAERV